MLALKPDIDVLVFDSGLGGLSILAELRHTLPHLRYAYIADNAALPYGNKAEDWLVERVIKVIEAAIEQVQPRILVIACNTASTLVLPTLRSRYQFPIVGVVPAIKPAAQQSQSRVIGLLATAATIKRAYIDTLIQEYAGDCQVIRVGSSELVEMAEKKLRGVAVDLDTLARVCAPFLAAPVDVLILGCTHFPLLKEEIQAVLPGVRLLDSGPAIAKRVAHVLLEPQGNSSRLPPFPLRAGAVSQAGEMAFFTAMDLDPRPLELSLQSFGLVQTAQLGLNFG